MEREEIRLSEIQGIVASGYGSLEAAAYVLLRITEAPAARHWLARLVPRVTTAAVRADDVAINAAFTWTGLAALGLDESALRSFPAEIREGMTHPHRTRILGDRGESAPERWAWGGPDNQPVHVLLLVYAKDERRLAEELRQIAAGCATGGVEPVCEPLGSSLLREPATNCVKEHFGFCDALSQPFIREFSRSGRADREENTVAAGEFVLGYDNEYGRRTEGATLPPERDPQHLLRRSADTAGMADLAADGTYLVFRQLQQHVQRFWQFLDHATVGAGPEERTRLAAKMVGRWPNGSPLVRTDSPHDTQWSRDNTFAYHHADAAGLRCPLGSHVRRANPRDSLDPGPGTARSVAVNRRHRLLRRGRAYGPPVHPSLEPHQLLAPEDGVDRGLHFICVCGNVSRQFEFVQQTWLNNRKFAGLYEDADPIVGDHDPDGDGAAGTFTEQRDPVRRRVKDIPNFVTTRGGAYFFLPGMSALRYLATMPVAVEAVAGVQPA